VTLILPGGDVTADIINGLEHGAWTSFTPTFTASAGSAGLGNATVTAAYQQVGKRVHCSVNITFGGTSTYGTAGVFYFALPILQSANMSGIPIGQAFLADASAGARRGGTVLTDGANQRVFIIQPDTGGFINTTGPWTWASTDSLRFMATYEAA